MQTAADNRIPRDAQRQSVKDLQELWPSLEGTERCLALIMIGDCFAHGYGTSVDVRECLRYLQLAAEVGDSQAVDAVLLPISAAILGETEHNLLQSADIKRAIRPALRSFEEDLCRFPRHERYSRRWIKWIEITNGMVGDSPITIEDFDGSLHVLDLDDEASRDRCILEDIKDPIRAIARKKARDSTPVAIPLLQLAASMDWRSLLQKLHARDAKMLHHLYGNDDFSPEVANFGSMLLAAMYHGRPGLVKFLVQEVGVSVKVQPDCAGLAADIGPLHLAFGIPEDDLRDTIDLLIDHGADVNLNSRSGVALATLPCHFPLEVSGPPLDVAISMGRLSLVNILLERGASPFVECQGTVVKSQHKFHNPLQLAVALHVHEIVDAILDHLMTNVGKTGSLPRKDITGNLMRHLAGQMLGGKGLFWKWLLHGSHYKEACRKTIQACLNHGLDINGIVDEDGDTPLIFAAAQNPCHNYVLETLLDHGANPNTQNKNGAVALSLCIDSAWDSADYSRCVKALISAGADVHLASPNGRQPIHLHAAANMKESVNLLLDAGADIEARSNNDETPLAIAVLSDAYACVETLLDRDASIHAVIHPPSASVPATALDFAANMGNVRMFRLLTKRGALPHPPIPPNSDIPPGSSALHHAAEAGRAEILRVALREFPTIYRTPELLSQLDCKGYTVLHFAARNHLGCVRELLLAGAPLETRDLNRQFGSGHTPLGASVQRGAFRISRFLLQNGACPWVRGPPGERWWSFLCEGLVAARMEPDGGPGRVAVLLEETWEWVVEWDLLRARDVGGRTILHLAVYLGWVEVVKLLVERGASVYDMIGKPMEHVPWERTDLAGLNCLGFSRVLRLLSPEQHQGLYDPRTGPIPDEDKEEVVRYMEGLKWPVAAVSGGKTDSEDVLERNEVSKSARDLDWDDTTDKDREDEQVGPDENDEEAGISTSETLGAVAESSAIAATGSP